MAMTGDGPHGPSLEPTTQHFLDGFRAPGALPFASRSAAEVRAALAALQSGPTGKPIAAVEDLTFNAGPTGAIPVRIVRPVGALAAIPVIMFFHGGGWIAGDTGTHDRLIREIAVAVHAAVVFVGFGRAPEVQFPTAVEQAYAATAYVVNNARSLNLDATRLAVVGDGTGGTMAAAVTILSKQRRGPKIAFQVLFYPPTAHCHMESHPHWHTYLWLTAQDMEWLWGMYAPNGSERDRSIAAPLSATLDELRGLPDVLLITAEVDVLRDEGEAYARKLQEASVRTTCTRYVGTIHDFVMLNALADTPAARGALGQAAAALRSALA